MDHFLIDMIVARKNGYFLPILPLTALVLTVFKVSYTVSIHQVLASTKVHLGTSLQGNSILIDLIFFV